MLERFLEEVRGEAYDLANAPSAGDVRLPSLLKVLLGRLEESAVLDDGQIAYFGRESSKGQAEVHGYSVDTEDDVLFLYFLIDANEEESFGSAWTVRSTTKESLDRAFRRLDAFLRLVRESRTDDVEESQPASELIEIVGEYQNAGKQVIPCVLSTGTISERTATSEARDNGRREVWDLVRLSRMCGGIGDEPLSIDFLADFGTTLPCLVTPAATDGIQVLLTCIPGPVLAQVYNTYRARLLERNVRSFLQFAGKVNKGIRETLLLSPARFLPYNNGISGTASRVDLDELGDGLARIKAVHDFQIVNGGQTTASVASAVRRDHADLSSVSVAMKLTIVPAAEVDRLVPLVSKYANTQNRIQEADFSANHPWHVALERLSRETWTEPSDDAPRGTRWYYERSRGQYADELAAANTQASKRRFRQENPRFQRFGKTDLAKFALSWDQRPAVVSRGAQKCFVEFMSQLSRAEKPLPVKEDFKRIASLGILFHRSEQLCGELEFKGYRAQVVTFSIARLSRELGHRFPWDAIWKDQVIPEALIGPFKMILLGVRDVVVSPPGGRNVTEWCKRDDCWSAVLELPLSLKLPIANDWPAHAMFDSALSSKPIAEGPMAVALADVPFEVFYAVSNWAKLNGSLDGRQRHMSYSFGGWRERNRQFTQKQAVQARKILLAAVDAGFSHPYLGEETVEKLRSGGDSQASSQ